MTRFPHPVSSHERTYAMKRLFGLLVFCLFWSGIAMAQTANRKLGRHSFSDNL